MIEFTADLIFSFLVLISWDLQFDAREETKENQAFKIII
jgi:hypothetical protein